MAGLRKVTIVVEGGDIGAAFAIALGAAERIAGLGYTHRRDGTVQVTGIVEEKDSGARDRWAKRCRAEGLSVARAPWEKKAKIA